MSTQEATTAASRPAVRWLLSFLLVCSLSFGDAYDVLKKKAEETQSSNRLTGWAYIVSGAVTLGISIPGYYLSQDTFARVIYSVGETLGVGAVGYGFYLVLVSDEYSRFNRTIESTKELSRESRAALSKTFLEENADRSRNTRRMRAISHSLMGGLNVLNAFTASHQELKTALFFVGGVNFLVALSCLVGSSEEEALLSIGPTHIAIRF